MKELLRMDASAITDLLGTVGSPLIVISELIKNAIDAAADNISICYNKVTNSITVIDDGQGFSLDDILDLSTPGVSHKKANGNVTNEKGVFYTGSKGLGLLSVFSLCDHLNIQTNNNLTGGYHINWSKKTGSYYYEKTNSTHHKEGTTVLLNNVNSQVMTLLTSESEIKKLRHISTYLYKHKDLSIPKITLMIDNGLPYSLLYKSDFMPMLYDVNYQFDCKTKQLFFQCIDSKSHINNEQIMIDSFDTSSVEGILEQHYGIKGFIRTRTNDTYNDFIELEGADGIPSFEGRILVYERQTAGGKLKDYGAGVNLYVNDFALYNYLSDGLDWLALADFSQRKKATRLKPHNVYGYVNLPDFNEANEQLKISNERADFIQDVVFLKLMYLIKGVILFMILNIDVAEKNPKYKEKGSDLENDSTYNAQKKDVSTDEDTNSKVDVSLEDKAETIESGTSDYEDGGDNERCDDLRDQEENYEPVSDFRPQIRKKRFLSFTSIEGKTIDKVKNSDELGNKIYSTIFELSKLNYPYATVCLYRVLMESATQKASLNLLITYNDNDLSGSIRNVLNEWSNRNITREFKAKIVVWRDLISKRDLIKQLNLYIHYSTPIDSGLIFDSWQSMKGYIYHCIKGID